MSAQTIATTFLLVTCIVGHFSVSEGFGSSWHGFPSVDQISLNCKFSADRSDGSCQKYTKECTDIWTHDVVVTNLQCPGSLFYSETRKKCVDPKTFGKRCFSTGFGFGRW